MAAAEPEIKIRVTDHQQNTKPYDWRTRIDYQRPEIQFYAQLTKHSHDWFNKMTIMIVPYGIILLVLCIIYKLTLSPVAFGFVMALTGAIVAWCLSLGWIKYFRDHQHTIVQLYLMTLMQQTKPADRQSMSASSNSSNSAHDAMPVPKLTL